MNLIRTAPGVLRAQPNYGVHSKINFVSAALPFYLTQNLPSAAVAARRMSNPQQQPPQIQNPRSSRSELRNAGGEQPELLTRERKEASGTHADVAADGVDLLVGPLAEPVAAHLVEYLVHALSPTSSLPFAPQIRTPRLDPVRADASLESNRGERLENGG